MNEKLIKELIRCKLDAANTIIDHMPSEMSEEIRNVGRVILEGLNESLEGIKERPSCKTGSSEKLNSIPVE